MPTKHYRSLLKTHSLLKLLLLTITMTIPFGSPASDNSFHILGDVPVAEAHKPPLAFAGSLRNQQRQQRRQEQQHLVLVGGGHAHVQVIKALNAQATPSNLKITLIDAQKSASYSGMVPGCVAGLYTPEDTLLHLEPLADWAGMEFVNDRVIDIDLEQKLVYLMHSENPISFDAISMDIGSTSRDLDIVPGAREYTIPTRPIHKLIERLEDARQELLEESDPTKFVVIGGGAAGIELAMAVSSRWKHSRPELSCTVLDGGSELLPQESQAARDRLKQTLEEKNICVRHHCNVKEVTSDAVILSSGAAVPFTHCIWATGAGAHPLAWHLSEQRGLETTKHGWIQVQSTLQSTSHPFVFAAGDCASIQYLDNGPPPKAGVYAVRAGPVLIENLPRFLEGRPLKEYKPQDDFLKLLICGDDKALGFRFGLAFHGKWVFQMKDHIDRNFLKLFQVDGLPKPRPGELNTAQDDEEDSEKAAHKMNPADAAALIQRSDDEVDYEQAWRVLRGMADDESYREAVLELIDVPEEALIVA